ncbi:MAG: hypothetical protein Q4Q03_07930 [Bowdeniella nasicola]|nr:hypothetical protein [Bowdeniella nasicola]
MAAKFYYNIKTGTVEEGKQSAFVNRMGPYDTAEEAARALQIAQQRNQAWEEDQAEWDNDDWED